MEAQNLNPETTEVQPQQLRSFGLLVGGVFTLISVWPLVVHQEPLRTWALLPGCLLLLGALIKPLWLRPLFMGWMKVGHVLGFINTRIILSIGFFFVFTPIGLIRRMMGKDSLHRRFEPKQSTYRSPRQARPGDHMKKQF